MNDDNVYVYYKLKNGCEGYGACQGKDKAQAMYDSIVNEKWKMMSDIYLPDIFKDKERKRLGIKGTIIWFISYLTSVLGLFYAWEYVDTLQFGSPQSSIMDTAVAIIVCSIFASVMVKKFNK